MKRIFITLLLFLSYLSYSQTIPEKRGFVADYENLFTPEQNAELTKILTDYEKETSVEIAILTVKDFESDIADFAQKTGEKWGVGKKDVNNGLLIVISKNRKVLHAATGYGLEGYLPDGWLRLEGDSIVQKYFKDISTSTKKDTVEVLNKANNLLKTSKNWVDQNVTDSVLRNTLSDVGIIQNDATKEKTIFDTNARYFEGAKAFALACMNRIGKEYSKDTNSNLIKKNKEEKGEDNIISWLIKHVPWWLWIIIVGLWILLFIFDPGLALQILFLGFAGKGGGSSGGFGGGKFGGGGSSSRW
jgi:uncharacterized protein